MKQSSNSLQSAEMVNTVGVSEDSLSLFGVWSTQTSLVPEKIV